MNHITLIIYCPIVYLLLSSLNDSYKLECHCSILILYHLPVQCHFYQGTDKRRLLGLRNKIATSYTISVESGKYKSISRGDGLRFSCRNLDYEFHFLLHCYVINTLREHLLNTISQDIYLILMIKGSW